MIGDNETLLHIYKCRKCKKIYSVQVSFPYERCSVLHGPDSCCHFKEKEISLDRFNKIMGVLDE